MERQELSSTPRRSRVGEGLFAERVIVRPADDEHELLLAARGDGAFGTGEVRQLIPNFLFTYIRAATSLACELAHLAPQPRAGIAGGTGAM